jgi:hypothetical protein
MLTAVHVSRVRPAWIPILVLLLAFILRLYHLDFQSIWWDEGHSIEMASAPASQIATLPGMDVHPPGYFLALHHWMAVAGRSEFALRFLSVAFSLLTVALLMRVGGHWAKRPGVSRAVLLAGGLAAISPVYLAYAQEVRMYAMVTFFTLASGYGQWQLIQGKRQPGGARQRGASGTSDAHTARRVPARPYWLNVWWLVYVAGTVASLYTHYFVVFWLIFQNLAWLVWVLCASDGRRRQRLATWISSQVAIVFLYLPQLSLALHQTTAYANPNLQPPALMEFLSRSWLAYTLGLTVYPGMAWLSWTVAAVSGALILGWLWRARRTAGHRSTGALVYLLGWLGIPLAAYFAVLQRRPSFEPRYMLLVTPALFLLWGGGLVGTTQPGNRGRMALQVGLAAVLGAALGLGSYSYFANPDAYKDDSAGVVAWLADRVTPEDLVVVDVPHPFHYYAERLPAPMRYLFVDVNTAAQTLNREAAGHTRFYWITWRGSDTDPRGVIPFLLDKAGRRAGALDFRGYHVTWWDLPAGATFSLPNDLPAMDVVYGDVIRLDGLAYSATVPSGGSGWATAHFTLLSHTRLDYRVSMRLRDARDTMLPPTDKDLLDDRHLRSSAWPLDDPRLNQAINVYSLPVPAAAQAGEYWLEAVVYDATTLNALPVTRAAGEVEDGISARLGQLVVTP